MSLEKENIPKVSAAQSGEVIGGIAMGLATSGIIYVGLTGTDEQGRQEQVEIQDDLQSSIREIEGDQTFIKNIYEAINNPLNPYYIEGVTFDRKSHTPSLDYVTAKTNYELNQKVDEVKVDAEMGQYINGVLQARSVQEANEFIFEASDELDARLYSANTIIEDSHIPAEAGVAVPLFSGIFGGAVVGLGVYAIIKRSKAQKLKELKEPVAEQQREPATPVEEDEEPWRHIGFDERTAFTDQIDQLPWDEPQPKKSDNKEI